MIIPETVRGLLAPRQTFASRCPSGYTLSGNRCVATGWTFWGRWVLAAIIIAFFILLFVGWTCFNNRRRRRAGMRPRYGTGWMMGQQGGGYPPPPPPNNAAPQYNTTSGGGGWFGGNKHNSQYNQPPPPQYTPSPVPNQYTGQTFNSNEGYYGQQRRDDGNNDIPLQPQSTYHPPGGEPVYEPPAGPPPAKK